jgi:hypothetical protein
MFPGNGRIQKLNRLPSRQWRQMHVAHRRRQILVSGELLNLSRYRPFHRQMTTEGVPKNVNTRFHVCSPRGPFNGLLDRFHRHRRAIALNEDPPVPQVLVFAECRAESPRELHRPRPSAPGGADNAFPLPPPPFAGSADRVARQVLYAIDRGVPVVYAPPMWSLIMFVVRLLSRSVMRRVSF